MGRRFRKSFKIAPGMKLNLGKRASSLSIDRRGLTLNVGKMAARATAGRLGRRASYSRHTGYNPTGGVRPQNSGSHNPVLAIGLVLLAVLSVVAMAMFGP
jgi:hypothetical protein